jgi:hypothetical protein
MNTSHNEPWLERSLALLDQSADALDAATLSKLTRARHAALAQPRQRHWQLGLVAVACTAVLALAIGLVGRHSPSTQVPSTATLDAPAIDAIASDDDTLDLSEDLDFYAWLDAQQNHGEG